MNEKEFIMYETSTTFHEFNVWDEDTLTYYFQSEEVNSKLESTTISKSDSNLISYASLLIRFIIHYLSKKQDLARYDGYMCINQDYESKWYHINKKLFQNFINFCVCIGFFEEKKERSNNQYIKVNTEFIFSILDEEGQWKKSEQEERETVKRAYEERKEKRRETIVQNRKRNPETADSVFEKFTEDIKRVVDSSCLTIEEEQYCAETIKKELGYSLGDSQVMYCLLNGWRDCYNKDICLTRIDFLSIRKYFTVGDDYYLTPEKKERIYTAIKDFYSPRYENLRRRKHFGNIFATMLQGWRDKEYKEQDSLCA